MDAMSIEQERALAVARADALFDGLEEMVTDRTASCLAVHVPEWVAKAAGPGVKAEWVAFVHAVKMQTDPGCVALPTSPLSLPAS